MVVTSPLGLFSVDLQYVHTFGLTCVCGDSMCELSRQLGARMTVKGESISELGSFLTHSCENIHDYLKNQNSP